MEKMASAILLRTPVTALLMTVNIHYRRMIARELPPPFTFYGTRAIRRAKHAGIARGAEPAATLPGSASEFA